MARAVSGAQYDWPSSKLSAAASRTVALAMPKSQFQKLKPHVGDPIGGEPPFTLQHAKADAAIETTIGGDYGSSRLSSIA